MKIDSNSKIYFFIPAAAKLDELLVEKYGKKILKVIDLYYYIIDYLYTSKFVRKSFKTKTVKREYLINKLINNNNVSYVATLGSKNYNELLADDKFYLKQKPVPLNTIVLRKILTTRFVHRVIKDLLAFDYIRRDEYYIPGEKSYCYTLNPLVHSVKFTSTEVTNEALIKRIIQHKAKEFTHLPMHIQQIVNNLKEFSFDHEAACKFIEEYKECDEKKDELSVKEAMRYKVDKIRNQDYEFSIDPKSRRFFCTHNNMKKELRQFIYDKDGNKLVELDIANCQPLLLVILYKYYQESHPNAPDIEPLYKDLVLKGQLYEYIINNFYKDELKKYGFNITREKFKTQQLLTYYFCTNYELQKYKLKVDHEVFKKVFPVVAKFIHDYKEYYNNSEFSIIMQGLEAEIMMDTIAPILLGKGIKFIPIHDSFLVSKKDLEIVKGVIINTFEINFGINPTLKVKEYV